MRLSAAIPFAVVQRYKEKPGVRGDRVEEGMTGGAGSGRAGRRKKVFWKFTEGELY
jgi:hypothetical protein